MCDYRWGVLSTGWRTRLSFPVGKVDRRRAARRMDGTRRCVRRSCSRPRRRLLPARFPLRGKRVPAPAPLPFSAAPRTPSPTGQESGGRPTTGKEQRWPPCGDGSSAIVCSSCTEVPSPGGSGDRSSPRSGLAPHAPPRAGGASLCEAVRSVAKGARNIERRATCGTSGRRNERRRRSHPTPLPPGQVSS